MGDGAFLENPRPLLISFDSFPHFPHLFSTSWGKIGMNINIFCMYRINKIECALAHSRAERGCLQQSTSSRECASCRRLFLYNRKCNFYYIKKTSILYRTKAVPAFINHLNILSYAFPVTGKCRQHLLSLRFWMSATRKWSSDIVTCTGLPPSPARCDVLLYRTVSVNVLYLFICVLIIRVFALFRQGFICHFYFLYSDK